MNEADLTAPAGGQDSEPVRAVSDVETLRALADPIRLRILSTLMLRRDGALPVMSVKELAANLDEPQTKLYRHVKNLEAVGLIRAVTSRVVSGIVEHLYQACQSDLMLGPSLTATQKLSAEAEAATAAVLEFYRNQFFAAYRADRLADEFEGPDAPEREPHQKAMLAMNVAKVPAAKAAQARERLQQVINDLNQAQAEADASGADTVTVNLLLGYFSPEEPSR